MMRSTTRTWRSESIISSGVLAHSLGMGSIRVSAPVFVLVDGTAGIRHQGLRPQEDSLSFRKASARPSGLALVSESECQGVAREWASTDALGYDRGARPRTVQARCLIGRFSPPAPPHSVTSIFRHHEPPHSNLPFFVSYLVSLASAKPVFCTVSWFHLFHDLSVLGR